MRVLCGVLLLQGRSENVRDASGLAICLTKGMDSSSGANQYLVAGQLFDISCHSESEVNGLDLACRTWPQWPFHSKLTSEWTNPRTHLHIGTGWQWYQYRPSNMDQTKAQVDASCRLKHNKPTSHRCKEIVN